MRITLATQSYIPPHNGQAVFSQNLVAGLVEAGHQVQVIAPAEGHEGAGKNGVQMVRVPAIPLAPRYHDAYVTLLAGGRADRALSQFRPDVVHIQDHYPLCRAVAGQAQRQGLPLLGTNHFVPRNISANLPLLRHWPGFMKRLLWRTVRLVFNRVDLATAPTETAAQLLREHIRPPVVAVSCGVDTMRFAPQRGPGRAAWRRRFGLAPGTTMLLYVGRLATEKRLDVILHALARGTVPRVQLAIAGRGRQRTELESLAARLQLGERIVFTGYVPAHNLPALYQAADLFVMPGDVELQSLATLEAMASGLPVLLADASALPELVQEGDNGYLFRAGDASSAAERLTALVAERDRWPQMGAASRRIAEDHTLQRTVAAYERLYGHLIAGGQAGL
jgi:glycosyltransferase involved in cell wall biosynthesis